MPHVGGIPEEPVTMLALVKGYQPINQTADIGGVSAVFTTFVNEELLAPLGIAAAPWQPNTATGALFYSHAASQPLNLLNGTGFANRTLREGSGGIQLSLREISGLFTRMWLPDQFLSKPMLDKMKEFDMGGRMVSDPLDGPAFVKGGFYGLDDYGAQESSCVVRFGNGLTAVVVINGGVNAFQTLIDAYNSSWYEPAVDASRHQAVSRRAAHSMQQARQVPAVDLEGAMAVLNPLPGRLLFFDSPGPLRLVPDRDSTIVRLSWDASPDARVSDTLYLSGELLRWGVLERFPGRAGGGVNERLHPVNGGAGHFFVERVREPDTDSLVDLLNRTPAAIPFSGHETTLGTELLATGLSLTGYAAGPSTSRTDWPPLNDKPPIHLEIDRD